MQRLLIANRGEIAVRIIRAARELGLTSIAVVSEIDQDSFAAQMADETIVVGPPPAMQSYLDQAAILNAAITANADAIHPGYGFLAENADFADRVSAAGLIWVGPSSQTIRLMGDKARARQCAVSAGVPTVPGTDGVLPPVATTASEELDGILEKIGFPLLIKASAGGGGRGIHLANSRAEFLTALDSAQREAQTAFGSPEVYAERFIANARHVEVQVLGDGETAIHLGERDCTLQRRKQKLIEEAPAPYLPQEVRDQIWSAAIALCQAVGYRGAGTVEFLYDPARHEAAFIEMNTRLQVEHPVTERLTNIDLVKEQLRIAAGEPLRLTQADVVFSGHVIEMRVNAEDPAFDFFPSPGLIESIDLPGGPGVRVDSGYQNGHTVSPYYDSLVAKIIVSDHDRPGAIARAMRAIGEFRIRGIATNAPALAALLASPGFRQAIHHTGYVEEFLTQEVIA